MAADDSPSAALSYGETFEKMWPYYLAIGMSYEQYWERDAWLARDYREAHDFKRSMRNQELWLGGMYIYEVMSDLAPLYRPLSDGKGLKPYREYPIPITPKEVEAEKERQYKKKIVSMRQYLKAKTATFNGRFQDKK